MAEIKSHDNMDEELEKLYDELEFYALTKKLLGQKGAEPTATQKKRAKKEADTGQLDLFAMFDSNEQTAAAEEETLPTNRDTWQTRQAKYHLVKTAEQRQQLIATLLHSPAISLDTETNSTEPIRATLVGLSFAVAEGEGWYVPVPKDEAERLQMMEEFRPVYEKTDTLKIGQNLKYDLLVLQNPTNGGINLAGPMFDTMIAH